MRRQRVQPVKATADALRERARRLELIAGVGQRATAILELDELLHEAIALIRERVLLLQRLDLPGGPAGAGSAGLRRAARAGEPRAPGHRPGGHQRLGGADGGAAPGAGRGSGPALPAALGGRAHPLGAGRADQAAGPGDRGAGRPERGAGRLRPHRPVHPADRRRSAGHRHRERTAVRRDPPARRAAGRGQPRGRRRRRHAAAGRPAGHGVPGGGPRVPGRRLLHRPVRRAGRRAGLPLPAGRGQAGAAQPAGPGRRAVLLGGAQPPPAADPRVRAGARRACRCRTCGAA